MKSSESVMPVPDRIRDDVSGIQKILELLDSDFRQNDKTNAKPTFYESIKQKIRIKKKPDISA